jgi:hypothetical protein
MVEKQVKLPTSAYRQAGTGRGLRETFRSYPLKKSEWYRRTTMNFFLVRAELRRMRKKNLLRVLMSQKESKCLLNGICSLHFEYKGYTFCLSEVLGEGCESEKMKKLEKEACERGETEASRKDVDIPLFDCMRRSSYNLYRRKG